MKYAFIRSHAGQFRITVMTRVLEVSRSAYYRWLRGGEPGPRARARAKLDALVKDAFEQFKSRYGAPRLTRHLNDSGHSCDEKTVASSLRRQSLRAKAAKRFKATTKSDHGRPVAGNVLAQDFYAARANEKWAGDITYLWTDEGWVYLAVLLDLHSYNYRRFGPRETPADPAENPEVNVGTGSLDQAACGAVVRRFIADLRAYDFLGRHLDVRENVKFRGRELARWIHERYPGRACVLSIEFKKFFMDEWTGVGDIEQIQAIRDALQATVPGLLDELGHLAVGGETCG